MIAGAETEIIGASDGGAGDGALMAIAGALILKLGANSDGVSGLGGPYIVGSGFCSITASSGAGGRISERVSTGGARTAA